ncbi:endo-1,4-beta-xylanase [Bacteroides sp. 51]|uniref:endo-1,4-beta-xylanase n=1 Tax=Bacteroides sp. 51 TaxID=2302938 RepID=UPI0013D600C1|nr:endo-1,4-beta-xylanase [Bacteroides sp. 51]NDV81933.1 endo-1,4-beta-xylanase [Bacteroides sp. 51]
MKKPFNRTFLGLLAIPLLWACSTNPSSTNEDATLKAALKDKFYIGAALNEAQITGRDTAGVRVLEQHFNSIVPENCMKCMYIHPEEGRYDFDQPDQFVALGERNNMFIIGHTLIWHSQIAPWFFTDEKGEDVSPEVLKARMKEHISTIVGRYKGRIKGWDVVNEAILDNGDWRASKFYEILGEEFIALAFQYAHEADPEAELYYNDYNEWHAGKRETIVKMVKNFKERGIRIDGIGMQGHVGMDYPSIEEYEESILAFSGAGVKVMITELDISALPMPDRNVGAEVSASFEYKKEMNPYENGLPTDKMQEWTNRMAHFFGLFLKHQDKVARVTLWGVADGDSWKNDFPMPGRTDYPLLFDRTHQPKPVVETIIEMATKEK